MHACVPLQGAIARKRAVWSKDCGGNLYCDGILWDSLKIWDLFSIPVLLRHARIPSQGANICVCVVGWTLIVLRPQVLGVRSQIGFCSNLNLTEPCMRSFVGDVHSRACSR